jgi:hypothetical protein
MVKLRRLVNQTHVATAEPDQRSGDRSGTSRRADRQKFGGRQDGGVPASRCVPTPLQGAPRLSRREQLWELLILGPRAHGKRIRGRFVHLHPWTPIPYFFRTLLAGARSSVFKRLILLASPTGTAPCSQINRLHCLDGGKRQKTALNTSIG